MQHAFCPILEDELSPFTGDEMKRKLGEVQKP
jgi:hypothetical protein